MTTISNESEIDLNDLKTKLNIKIENLNNDYCEIIELINLIDKYLLKEKDDFEQMKIIGKKYDIGDSDIIKFNVGGTYYSTLRSTLERKIKKPHSKEYYSPNLLQAIVSGAVKVIYDDKSDAIFIDRNPKYFIYILDYLRNIEFDQIYKLPKLSQTEIDEFLKEAEYYELNSLIEIIKPAKYGTMELDSVIIKTNDEKLMLKNLCNFVGHSKWKLLYRGSEDGFNTSNFHLYCDGHADTLTIIKTNNNCIFGGYSTANWDQSNTYKADPSAFIFSFKNEINKPIRIECVDHQFAICCMPGYGPVFGSGYDFSIENKSSNELTGYSNLSHTYKLEGYSYGTHEAQTFLAGSRYFNIDEIEVFQEVET